ncbi:phosphohydrolase [Candidatus Microgenomates bacterium]|nr:phosphohydrolase [Candidatus Microgenomates bacterium]
MIIRDKALKILHEHIQNPNLRRHGLAVEAAMKALAGHFGETDMDKWGIVGLLHDADYEETKDDVAQHGLKTVEWLKAAGETDQEIFAAIAGHNYSRNGSAEPSDNLSWSVYCVDELTGLIVAAALVQPEKKLSSVTLESVQKKFNQNSFAAGVDREQIKMCQEKLGIPLPEFIKITLESMQGISTELGL